MDAETFARANWGKKALLIETGYKGCVGTITPRYTMDFGWDENYFYFLLEKYNLTIMCRVEWVELIEEAGKSASLPLPG